MLDKKIHPIAALFPPLSDEELEELAADIKERGLLYPIVLDQEGQILDGRNRLAACSLAGVAPQFITYEGEDPGGYALSANIIRRHLNKGQQAMILVKAANNFESKFLGWGRRVAKDTKISTYRLSNASIVQQYAPEMAEEVIRGSSSLNTAYRIAEDRKRQAEEREKNAALIRRLYKDLDDRIKDEELSPEEAAVIVDERRRAEEEAEREWVAHARRVSTAFAQAIRTLANQTLDPVPGGESIYTVFDQRMVDGVNQAVNKETIGAALVNLEEIWRNWP